MTPSLGIRFCIEDGNGDERVEVCYFRISVDDLLFALSSGYSWIWAPSSPTVLKDPRYGSVALYGAKIKLDVKEVK